MSRTYFCEIRPRNEVPPVLAYTTANSPIEARQKLTNWRDPEFQRAVAAYRSAGGLMNFGEGHVTNGVGMVPLGGGIAAAAETGASTATTTTKKKLTPAQLAGLAKARAAAQRNAKKKK